MLGKDPLRETLTYADVSIVPRASDVLPADVDVSSRLTRRINVSFAAAGEGVSPSSANRA